MAFSIVKEHIQSNRRYRMTQHCVEFRLNPLDRKVRDPEWWLKCGFREIFDHLVNNLSQEDKVGITFTADDFETDFHIPFKPVPRLNFENVWDLLNLLYQSKKEAIEGDTFRIIATSFSPFRGTGRPKQQFFTFEDECKSRRGIICIKNKDNLCLARALVVAIACIMNTACLKQIRQNIGKRQDQEALKLIADAGVNIPVEGAGLAELRKFQRHLSDYKITVYEYSSKGKSVLFEGPDAEKKINLLHHKNHFNVITSLTAAFGCSYFCERCHVPYSTKDKHRCAGKCPCCRHDPPCEKVREEILCNKCNRKFRGQVCFDFHKVSSSKSQSLCQRVKRCTDCLKTVKADREHVCGELFCKICKKFQPQDHQCYMQVDKGKAKLDDTLFVFYDLETWQHEQNARGEYVHTPVLCVFQQRCDECFELSNDILNCKKCGLRRQIIKCENLIQPFFEHLMTMAKKFKRVNVIAHNGQSYDHQFILKYVMENVSFTPEIIKRGSKILMMSVKNLKFIDSINYFPMKLAALPKAFGLSELKKGYFPHFFNNLANKNYVGPMPDSRYYSPDTMKVADREKFLQWYEENKHKTFNLEQEMIDYCISDVDILTQACVKFHKMFLEQGNVSPFTEAITLPGACNKLFRRNFLKPQTIGIIPKNGYRNIDMQSQIATQWLIYEEQKRGINIRHALKEREATIKGLKVDGYCEETKQVFEFHGCYFHGCPQCFRTTDRDAPIHEDPTDSLNSRYERTLKKTQRLQQFGYELIQIWEHEFRSLLDKDKKLRDELTNHPLLKYLPLNPRDAFYGGRTGCTKSYYKVKPGEKIKYVDICSLYPFVCKYGKFPVGHPKLYVGNDECKALNLQETDGLIKCKILPPQDLYHPVLPQKMHDKLMFVLCRSCGESSNRENCCHSADERALLGTWTIEEVKKAIEKNYIIMEFFEVWAFDTIQYDKTKNTEGLFAAMMDKFLKIKQEASGWPSNCVTKAEKDAYVEAFLDSEGVQLEFDKIVKNPGLRSLAKLILNSFWGKFGQRENQVKCAIIRQPSELHTMDSDPSIDIQHVTIINEEVLLVSWKHKDEAADILSTVNVCLAGYTTSQARLRLFSYLEKLGDRVLYYDTDSVIYISRDGEYDIPTGSSLGDMTNELEDFGPNSFIIEFSSAGAKNYSFTVYSPTTGKYYSVCKVKGFSLNYQVGQQINQETMTQMIKNPSSSTALTVHQQQIRRTKTHQLVTVTEKKTYKPCLEKRQFDDNHDSVPYGFKKKRTF